MNHNAHRKHYANMGENDIENDIENLKNHFLSRGTYLYSPYMGVTPLSPFPGVAAC